MDRAELYRRIEKRVDMMVEQGFVEEVKSLISRGYGCDLKSMQSIGYRHICEFLNGRVSQDKAKALSYNNPVSSDESIVSWEETIRLLKRDTRRYAKRQLTWFRQDKDMVWLEPEEMEKAKELIVRFRG